MSADVQWPAEVAPTLRVCNGTPFMGDQDIFSNDGGGLVLTLTDSTLTCSTSSTASRRASVRSGRGTR